MLFFFAYFSLVKKNKVNKTNILSYYQIKKSSKVAKNKICIKRLEHKKDHKAFIKYLDEAIRISKFDNE